MPTRRTQRLRALATRCALVAAVSCVQSRPWSRQVRVQPAAAAPALRTDTGVTYGSFAEAAAFWDLHAAEALASREDQRLYLRAVQALVNGDEAAAEPLLQRLRAESQDAQLRGTSTQLLAQQYFAAGQWERYRALGEIASPQDPMRVMVEALGDRPGWTLVLPDGPTEVPTTRVAGLPTVTVLVNDKPASFLLDTGAPYTVINAEVAAEAGVTPVGSTQGVIRDGVFGRPARIEQLALGAVQSVHHPVMIVPTEGLTFPERPPESQTLQGILGWPLIRQLDLELDLAAGTTTVRRPSPRAVAERNLFFFFRPMVAARDSAGVGLHFLLDTGADGSILFNRIGKKTPLGRSQAANLGTSSIGRTVRHEGARIVSKLVAYLGGQRVVFEDIPLLPGSAVDGFLGADVLATGRVRIDARNGQYTLTP